MLRRISLPTRLAALVVVAVWLVYAVLAVAIFAEQAQSVYDRQENRLLGGGAPRPGGRGGPDQSRPFRGPRDDGPDDAATDNPAPPGRFSDNGAYRLEQLLDSSGSVVGGASELVLPVDEVARSVATRAGSDSGNGVPVSPRFSSVEASGRTFRVASIPLPQGGARRIAVDVTYEDGYLAGLAVALAVGGLIAGSAIAVLVVVAVRLGLRPLDRMRATAEHVAATEDPSAQVEAPPTNDALGRLGRAFGRMLERLHDAQSRQRATLDAQRRFLADASHQLRTPITSIRGNVAVLQRHPDLPAEDRDAALGDMAAEAERLARIAEEVLALVRIDEANASGTAPVGASGPSTLRPAEICGDAVAAARARLQADGRAVAFHDTTAGAMARGEAESLRRTLDALLENAAVHGRGDVTVWAVTLDASLGGGVRIVVADEGGGIPDADRATAFERFRRGSRAQNTPGTGLGLAIAAALVQSMGGRIGACDGGVEVVLAPVPPDVPAPTSAGSGPNAQ